jgi:hypothetical protein
VHTIREFGEIQQFFKSPYRAKTYNFIAQLPFEKTFPDTFQEFLVKDELADAYARWVKKYDIVSLLIKICF